MSKAQMFRSLVKQRLAAAADEIFGLFERTIAEFEEELGRSKEENQRQLRSHRTGSFSSRLLDFCSFGSEGTNGWVRVRAILLPQNSPKHESPGLYLWIPVGSI